MPGADFEAAPIHSRAYLCRNTREYGYWMEPSPPGIAAMVHMGMPPHVTPRDKT